MRGGRAGGCLTAISCTLIAAGAVAGFLGGHLLRWGPPPIPPGWASHGKVKPWTGRPLARSEPLLISIPRIKVRAHISPRGLTRSGTAAVPSLATPFLTSWFDRGPTPGQRGTAVVYGHVDSRKVGPAVFYRIGELRPGNLVYITLRDRKVAIFRVYSVALYAKAGFPTTVVYRYSRRPGLRLITCGGTFDPHTGHYLGNIVVFASLVATRH